MPADSEPTFPRTWRPLGVRLAAVFFTVMLTIVCIGAAIGLGAEVRAQFTVFQISTLIVMALGGLAVVNALVRCRVTATEEGVVVVNGYRTRRFTWAEVVAVRMPRGAPWASLDISDGTNVSVIGIQSSDGERAVRAVRELRVLLETRTPDVDH